jgi:predicted amidophosphoribosyltransferase
MVLGMKCPKCNATVQAGAKFCPECGQNLQEMKCAKCNAALQPGANSAPNAERSVSPDIQN